MKLGCVSSEQWEVGVLTTPFLSSMLFGCMIREDSDMLKLV